ncbi:ParB N-terminal domain-containing protein [Pseudobacillus wudalianchiensis]|uniref:Uncharacterized protein n=1 Tax=Pseudobacillus wudalianchiensis TaxID=1743143 RepID=A0A1B9AM87_9BACI|nr:ParB N-terminal domain-containing protein [Bacillus wudalianchiensis]OCA84982.1 hypothetical protein A8F95_09760 [Bacillus wudalianchiensis]
MNHIMTSLKLLPIHLLELHEDFEPSRLEKTMSGIEKDQFLRHPILATRLMNGRYLVLDGVHRFTSLKKMGCRTVPIQEVKEEEFTFSAWHHFVESGSWYDKLLYHSALPWTREKKEGSLFVEIITGKDERHFLYKEDIASRFLESWHTVASSYTKHHEVRRIPPEAEFMCPMEGVLIKYGSLDYHSVAQYVLDGMKLPAGVTRFQVSGRLLNLQVPLALLKERNGAESEWNELLDRSRQSLRCYAEKVYLCEL